jgi:opacity protein-like surface antigen
MAKKILLLFLSFFIILSTQAQFKIGLRGGLNYSNVVGVPRHLSFVEKKFKVGYNIGVFSRIDIFKKISFNPELSYSNKGHRYSGTSNTSAGNLHLNYLNLHALIGYKVFKSLDVLVGPEVGYLLSARSKFDSENINVRSIWDNDFDFGITGGVNYYITDKLLCGFKYSHGLSSVIKNIDVRDESGVKTGEKAKLQNRTFQLTVGYSFK